MDEEELPLMSDCVANAKWWNSRFKAERMNEELEIEEAKTRHPSARN